jgi:ABC-2 type transport system ATP-binding protein
VALLGKDLHVSMSSARAVGVVFQSQSLDRKLTVKENLLHQGHLFALHGSYLRHRTQQVLEQFRLADRQNEIIETLSGGLRRRVELAKAMLHQPELLLLDEPSTGLDPGARREFWQHLESLNQQDGTTILLTTHLMDEAERCHRLAILSDGVLVALDTPDSLKSQVGGDVITLRTQDPRRLSQSVGSRFGVAPSVVDNTVRIERFNGHEFVAELAQAFPGQIDAITISKPSLEDAFIHITGHAFWRERNGLAR